MLTAFFPHIRSFVLAGVFVLILLQLFYIFHRTLQTYLRTSSSLPSSSWPPGFFSTSRDPCRNRHPSVSSLTSAEYALLDSLAETIVKVEAHRVFEDKEVGTIHGTAIQNNPRIVSTIRNQIHCWTNHGRWVRMSERDTKVLQHLGDNRFKKCDERFMEGLDKRQKQQEQEGGGGGGGRDNQHYLGEYDAKRDQMFVREAVKYRWVPDTSICGRRPAPEDSSSSTVPVRMGFGDDRSDYQTFSKPGFCKAMGRRNMLVVGDVTQYQLHDVITSAFGYPFSCHGELGCLHRSSHPLCVSQRTTTTDTNGDSTITSTSTKGSNNQVDSSLKFARNDILSVPWAVHPEDNDFPSGSTIEQTWATPTLLQQGQYRIVLLNKGLIWREDEAFLSELVFTIKHLWKNYPETLILYRATHPVSRDCMKMKEDGEDEAIAESKKDDFSTAVAAAAVIQRPLTAAPNTTTTTARTETKNGVFFRPTLEDVSRQNRMAKVVVEAGGGIFLDTEKMFGMRPDGRMGDHGDCSRFCAPGPLDAYADLLYNVIRILDV